MPNLVVVCQTMWNFAGPGWLEGSMSDSEKHDYPLNGCWNTAPWNGECSSSNKNMPILHVHAGYYRCWSNGIYLRRSAGKKWAPRVPTFALTRDYRNWYGSLVTQSTLEAQSASAYQITFESDDFRLRYSDKTIFKMAADRHLEFSKFGILVMCPVLERHSALSYKISR